MPLPVFCVQFLVESLPNNHMQRGLQHKQDSINEILTSLWQIQIQTAETRLKEKTASTWNSIERMQYSSGIRSNYMSISQPSIPHL